MKKLAFENTVSEFEMPCFRVIGLEKENNNLMLATPKTVYRGGTGSFTRSQLLAAALGQDEKDLFSGLSKFEIE